MRLRPGTIMGSLLLALVGFFVLYPLFMVFYGSFMGGAAPGEPASFSLLGYKKAYSDWETFKTLWTTIWLAAVRTLLSVAIGVFLAWVVTRTNTPGKRAIEILVWLQFFCPYLPMVMAWVLLGAPKVGLLNQILVWLLPIKEDFINIYSYWGIIWVSSAHWASVVFFLVTPAFQGMDAALEESSRMCGASERRTLFNITLPVLMPSILAAFVVVFVHLLESFEVELLLGYQKGIVVYTTKVWALLGYSPADYAVAMPLTTAFTVVLFGLIYLQHRMLAGKQYVTVTGRGFATRPTQLRRGRYVTLGLAIAYILFSTILPLGVLVMGTFMKVFGVFVQEPFTSRHWETMLADPRLLQSLKNTLLLGLGAASAGMILFFFISYLVVRTTFAGRKALDFISWLPWGIPGLMIGLCFLWAYVGGIGTVLNHYFGIRIYGTLWLMVLALVVRGMPLGVRAMNGALIQLGNELEECSRVMGGSWLYTIRRVVAPLIAPGFVAAWLLLFSIAVRNLSTVLLLYTPKSRTLSVLAFEYWSGMDYGTGMAAGLILIAIVIVTALIGLLVKTKFQIPSTV
ncbi:MAG: iron ABC transporter permease [Deltaproteobacteria bacterium]|nr:iron ABC transporter permease [Deltaproteobacteria bacterium]